MLARLLHIILTFSLLLSTTGLVMSKHFCKGELKSVAIYQVAPSCHQVQQSKHCPMHPPAVKPVEKDCKKGCCDTEMAFAKADNDLVVPEFPSLFTSLLAQLPASFNYGEDFASEKDTKSNSYLTYKPPPLVCDLPVRLQTFLC